MLPTSLKLLVFTMVHCQKIEYYKRSCVKSFKYAHTDAEGAESNWIELQRKEWHMIQFIRVWVYEYSQFVLWNRFGDSYCNLKVEVGSLATSWYGILMTTRIQACFK